MQLDDPRRGFSYKVPGPLDMRMNPARGEPAWQLIERLSERKLAAILTENADEPHAALIARLLKQTSVDTTDAAELLVRAGLTAAMPSPGKSDVTMSVRRTFQAIRIAVNDELGALDALLRCLTACLASGGRVAMLTFHSGEDRRVKKAFQQGTETALTPRSRRMSCVPRKRKTFSNRRAAAAKLRWAVRA
jgi:16S rRNA (cytosine1402-N4)-methyltransferase